MSKMMLLSSCLPFYVVGLVQGFSLGPPRSHFHTTAYRKGNDARLGDTGQFLFRRLLRRKPAGSGQSEEDYESGKKKSVPEVSRLFGGTKPTEKASVCVIGGGVSGLVAAETAANGITKQGNNEEHKVILLEASESLGGRVRSDVTEDGYVLDRGFAVFIEQYPLAKKLLDYEALQLGQFAPGALVKIKDETDLARVADPFRQPDKILGSLSAPVGGLEDKLYVVPLLFNVISKSLEELFEEEETDTLTALTDRWGFSENGIVDRFFKPFYEGIFLAPLEEQSSRMFSFVFKMFSEGAASLPEGGIGAVSKQLSDKALKAGADLRTGQVVTKLDLNDEGYLIQTADGKSRIQAKAVVVATEGPASQELLSQVRGLESLGTLPVQAQRSVGCLYYAFKTEPPVKEPILVLNGIGVERGNDENPVNNVCFPSVVRKSYAPEGCSLCSVTVMTDAMTKYKERDEELDSSVRKQLATWFPDYESAILNEWELKGKYFINNAQPAQLGGPLPAKVNGGRPPNTYRGEQLPEGLFVCGDHVSTATLNGALESGLAAGAEALKVGAPTTQIEKEAVVQS